MDNFEILIILFIFRLCIGSFANILIYRLPLNESIISQVSHCRNCKTPLKFYHNIPIFSWLFLRAKCAFCGKKISPIYPIVEFLSAFLILLAYIYENTYLAILLGLCFVTLIAISIIDLAYKAVPDKLLFISLSFSLAYGVMINLAKDEPFYKNLIVSAIFAIIFWILRVVLSKALNKEVMGSADIFILAIIGAILGFKLGIIAIYLSALFTLPAYAIIRKKSYQLPFVPFLSIGLITTYIFKDKILNYLGYLYE